jgi:deoxyribodipyrimidine photo-lyase
MKNQKYLTDNIPKEKLPKQYSVMGPYISALKPLLTIASNSKDYKFNPTGMGRTRIGEALAKGENPQTYYNSSQTVASQALKRELLIREFFHQAKKDWAPRRPSSSWRDDARANAWFNQWKNGETGHLLIDAGMSQLAKQGFMPNRVRMLCASFLTKNLRFWWEDGEQYFAKNLIDYNIDSNIGNWQWMSGTGFNSRLTDVLSPALQLKKYDPDLSYCRNVLGNKIVPFGLKASDFIRESSLYLIKPIVSYEDSKADYLKSLL